MQGDKALMGGLMRGDIDLTTIKFVQILSWGWGGGGANFDSLYHKLKVLLLLTCNYIMQFIGYDSVKLLQWI